MRRNSTHLELITSGATTWLPWISDPGSNRVDGYPNFDGFTGQSRSIRESAWQDFLDSGEELEIIPDPEPPPPEPDWLSFNLAMIPPTAESTFEVWLGQFKEPYRAALAVASSEGNAERVQGQYEILKDLASPTAEQITEWQGIADANHVPLRF